MDNKDSLSSDQITKIRVNPIYCFFCKTTTEDDVLFAYFTIHRVWIVLLRCPFKICSVTSNFSYVNKKSNLELSF